MLNQIWKNMNLFEIAKKTCLHSLNFTTLIDYKKIILLQFETYVNFYVYDLSLLELV